jgi:hypothetical protein
MIVFAPIFSLPPQKKAAFLAHRISRFHRTLIPVFLVFAFFRKGKKNAKERKSRDSFDGSIRLSWNPALAYPPLYIDANRGDKWFGRKWRIHPSVATSSSKE